MGDALCAKVFLIVIPGAAKRKDPESRRVGRDVAMRVLRQLDPRFCGDDETDKG